MGTVVTLALMALAYAVLFDLSDPYIGRGFPWGWAMAVLGAHVLGGFVAGGAAGRSPGLNGALSALLCPVLYVAGFFAFGIFYNLVLHGPAGLIPDYLNSAAEIREFLTDEEMAGALVLALVMAVYTSIAVFVGFVSGGAAGRFRSLSPGDGRSI